MMRGRSGGPGTSGSGGHWNRLKKSPNAVLDSTNSATPFIAMPRRLARKRYIAHVCTLSGTTVAENWMPGPRSSSAIAGAVAPPLTI